MRITTQYKRCEPDTATGYKIILTQVFSSFDPEEIDMVEDTFRAIYGSGAISEIPKKDFAFNYHMNSDILVGVEDNH